MLSLTDVKDWIKTFDVADNYYTGKLDAKKDKSIGIYQRKNNLQPNICIGGLKNTTYEVKPISILVHWTKNSDETERVSFDLHEQLKTVTNVKINDTQIHYLVIINNEPVEVGTDDKGIFERVIDFDLIYER